MTRDDLKQSLDVMIEVLEANRKLVPMELLNELERLLDPVRGDVQAVDFSKILAGLRQLIAAKKKLLANDLDLRMVTAAKKLKGRPLVLAAIAAVL